MSSTILSLVGEAHRQHPTAMSLQARSEDEQGWMVDVQLTNHPLQCAISGYFFEHALRSFSKALRGLQWSTGGEASLLSFDEELALIVVRDHRGSANLSVKLVHGAQSRSSVGSPDTHRNGAEQPILDSGFIHVDAGMLGNMAEQVEDFLRQPTLVG